MDIIAHTGQNVRHVKGEGGDTEGHAVRQEGDHQVRGHDGDEAVDDAGAKVEEAQRQTGDDKVDMVVQLRQREDDLPVEDGSGKAWKEGVTGIRETLEHYY